MKDLKVVFMGTPEFAGPILQSLIDNTHVVLVVSQPDKAVGRKRVITPSHIKSLALENGIEVFTPEKIREDFKRIEEVKPDLIVTCAYGQIIPKALLDLPKYGCINVHASLLPHLRGGAPIHHAIMDGYKETGVTIMYMDEKMDSGDIIKSQSIRIEEDDTRDSLTEKLMPIGGPLLIEVISSILDGTVERTPQDESEVTFGYVITKEDERLDFSKTTKEVYDKIRGLNSIPGAYFLLNGKHIKVYASKKGDKSGAVGTINTIYEDGIGIGTKDGEIIITEIKPEGKNRILVKDYLNGVDKKSLLGSKLNV